MNFRFTASDVGEKGEFIFEGKKWSEKTGQFLRTTSDHPPYFNAKVLSFYKHQHTGIIPNGWRGISPFHQAAHPELRHRIQSDLSIIGRAALKIQKEAFTCLQVEPQKKTAAAPVGKNNSCVRGRYTLNSAKICPIKPRHRHPTQRSRSPSRLLYALADHKD